ncbi:aldo/keto reductase [Streptomyces sp. CG1]|uniref:aldo/keto reductase n=1 Tax=Streptomyces sp. CG1 TaxID=1287523 RepID=UPI0034E2AA69
MRDGPVAALQSEYSLWTRGLERENLPAARELGVALVAFSPPSRGLPAGTLRSADALAADDIRREQPRFHGENLAADRRLVEHVRELAADAGCTSTQLDSEGPLPLGRGAVVRERDTSAAGLPMGRRHIPTLRATNTGARRGHDGRESCIPSRSTHVAARNPVRRPSGLLGRRRPRGGADQGLRRG